MEYPELAAVIGSTVPDYRGVFLRGHGWKSHIQNNGLNVGATSTNHRSSELGVVQGDATREVYGEINGGNVYFAAGSGATWPFRPPTSNGDHGVNCPSCPIDYSTTDNFNFYNRRVVPTADEIRPINMAVKYLIFVGD